MQEHIETPQHATPERGQAFVPPELERIGEVLYEVAPSFRADMQVPARVFADEELLEQLRRDHSLAQLVNVTTLPGIAAPAFGMPDMHEGYGFPVGGVAATEAPDGVISPGGIGFDINCGVRLLASRLRSADIGPRLEPLMHELSRSVPAGFGRASRQLAATPEQMDRILDEGVPYLVRELGLGFEEDLPHIESRGRLPWASARDVSTRARSRGHDQLGTLGGGNHFVEVQVVDRIHEPAAAAALGLSLDQVTVLIHTGSRGLGHQVCTDFLRLMDEAMARYGIVVPDRQLACAPLSSPEGQSYLGAMAAAANFGWCNRQTIGERARHVFARFFGPAGKLDLVYDVAHNTAKLERYGERTLCVHRKGATRAFGPSHPETPQAYRGVGQPVFIPGSMGTSSFLLVGTDESPELSLGSACHGAGRAMSRAAAKRQVVGHELRHQLTRQGVCVSCRSNQELAEEAPVAYKDVEKVVEVTHRAGLARKGARLRPIGVLKG
ncbi:MAG: RtcB family protein [Deltaproteobacteria bacterium]|nr:RtcB family protein [Deltaproteobacteria bacterium]